MNDTAPPTPSGPPLRRSRDGRILAGVCEGLATRFGLSPALVRLVFVVGALLIVGVALYVALAVALPEDNAEGRSSGARGALGAAAGFAVLLLGFQIGQAFGWSPTSAAFVAVPVLAIAALAIGDVRVRVGAVILAVAAAVPLLGAVALDSRDDGMNVGSSRPWPWVFIVFVALGAALILGRRGSTTAVGTAVASSRETAGRAQLHPPILLLLTLAAAAVAATAVWAITSSEPGPAPYGAVAAAALVVVGLGQILGAWRGRSYLLLPLGLAIAAPLAAAALADVRILGTGSDDPGTLARGAAERTYDLARGAGPVTVSAQAVEAGLRRLTIRKPGGTIDVRIAADVPVRLSVASAVSSAVVGDADAGRFRDGNGTFTLPGDMKRFGEPVEIRVEGFSPSIYARRAETPAQLRALRQGTLAEANAQLAATRRLLARERATLARLTRAYQAAREALSTSPSTVDRRVLGVQEDLWLSADGTSPWLRRIDPAVDQLARAQALRFDMARAAWRVGAVQRNERIQRQYIAQVQADVSAGEEPTP